MIKILFVCHGNICRSPMAEFIMKYIVKENEKEDEYFISSCATTEEEFGNNVYYLAQEILNVNHIPWENRKARKFKKEDYNNFDYIIVMDDENLYDIKHMCNDKDNKVYKLLYFSGSNRDVFDPWYTRRFDIAYDDIYEGCLALFAYIEKNEKKKTNF